MKVLDINFLSTSSLFDLNRLNIVAKFSEGFRIHSSFHFKCF